LGILLSLLFFDLRSAALGILQVCVADGAASVVGKKWGVEKIIYSPKKSYRGCFAFFVLAFLLQLPLVSWKVSLTLALIGTLLESLPFGAWDNLLIPFIIFKLYHVLGRDSVLEGWLIGAIVVPGDAPRGGLPIIPAGAGGVIGIPPAGIEVGDRLPPTLGPPEGAIIGLAAPMEGIPELGIEEGREGPPRGAIMGFGLPIEGEGIVAGIPPIGPGDPEGEGIVIGCPIMAPDGAAEGAPPSVGTLGGLGGSSGVLDGRAAGAGIGFNASLSFSDGSFLLQPTPIARNPKIKK
jgi:hypothetical protein